MDEETLDLTLAEEYFGNAMVSDGGENCLPKVLCNMAAKKGAKQTKLEKTVQTLAKHL